MKSKYINETVNEDNVILMKDSYKVGHWDMLPDETTRVYSYLESRNGANFPYVVFAGLQGLLLKYLVGIVVTQADIEEAEYLYEAHFGTREFSDRKMWQYIVDEWGGKLPLTIKAVAEGQPIPINNVLMSVVNNGNELTKGLTNQFESLLLHVWSATTIATLSRTTKEIFKKYLDLSSDNHAGIDFMLHDFGYRGVSSNESAKTGGAAHLINFLGTDTMIAMQYARKYYGAPLKGLAYSVPATEHSVMTALGKDGEVKIVRKLLEKHKKGILSVVADSYDIYNFVENIVGKIFKQDIVEREGVFVVRPDSVTPQHPTPEAEMVWILTSLWNNFGGNVNSKEYMVLDSHVRVLWGDGIDQVGIDKILRAVVDAGFSAENVVFGMGGGLLQKVNRDTQRFAFKCSAQLQDGKWVDIYKDPKDKSKQSKKGKLRLIKSAIDGHYYTAQQQDGNVNDGLDDQLVTVFENGELTRFYTFDEVRKNAELK